MPKYKEIKIDLKVSPEIILEEAIKRALDINVNEQIKNQTKAEDTNEPKQAE